MVQDVGAVGDHCGQGGHGAEATVGLGDGGNAVACGSFVEKHATATVDLQIDVAGRQQAGNLESILRGGSDFGNLTVFDVHTDASLNAVTVKQTVRGDQTIGHGDTSKK